MKVNEFLKIATKDSEVAEYNQYITIIHDATREVLAEGKAFDLLNINDVEGIVKNLQNFIITEIQRTPKCSDLTKLPLPKYNCPYQIFVV